MEAEPGSAKSRESGRGIGMMRGIGGMVEDGEQECIVTHSLNASGTVTVSTLSHECRTR
jgi:hypothetical protein